MKPPVLRAAESLEALTQGRIGVMSTTRYEAPAIRALGTVYELTEASGLYSADNPTGMNDAYSNY